MNFINTVLAQTSKVGSFQEEQIYEVAGSMGWLLIFVKGVFWLIVVFLVIIAAIALNRVIPAKRKKIFTCPKCGYSYKEKEWAKKCELWCKKYKSCNLEINKHRIIAL